MPFDFDAAVSSPFRMQPGLRRMAAGSLHLTPLAPGSRHQREKLAVLFAFAKQTMLSADGFDAAPALDALCSLAAAEHPQAFAWDGQRAHAPHLGVAVEGREVRQLGEGAFGLGDELPRCLRLLPPQWRLPGLLSLAFAEDFAIVDGRNGSIAWLAVALPSHWAPEEKVGHHFTEVHAPVADNALLVAAGDRLVRLVTGPERWERFVWTITSHPRLHAHPARLDDQRWPSGASADDVAALAWWRTEHQTFVPLPALNQAVFTIHVESQPLAEAMQAPDRAARLHDAIATMSPAVLAYRSLSPVREPLLAWLRARAGAEMQPQAH